MDYELEWYLVTKSRIVWTLALGGYFFLLFFFVFVIMKSLTLEATRSRPRDQGTGPFEDGAAARRYTNYNIQKTTHGHGQGDQGSSVNGRMLFDARSTLS